MKLEYKHTLATLFVVLAIPSFIYCQNVFKDSTVNEKLLIKANLLYGSSDINNSLAYRFIFGGAIPEKVINSSLNSIKKTARFGIYSTYQGEYEMEKKSKNNTSYFVGIALKTQQFMGGKISKDAFGMIFKGNAAYREINAEIHPTRVSYLSQTSLELSFSKNNSKYSIGTGFLGSYRAVNISNGTVFTSFYGDSISGYLQLEYLNSGKRLPRYDMPAFYINFINKIHLKKSQLQFSIQNLGLGIYSNLKHYKKIGDYKVEPVRIQRANLSNANSYNNAIDSVIQAIIPEYTLKSGSFLLPFSISVKWMKFISNSNIEKQSVELFYLYIPGFIPQLRYNQMFNSFSNSRIKFYPYASLALGGFDTYDLSFHLNLIHKDISYQVALGSIEGVLFPNKTHGINASVILNYLF